MTARLFQTSSPGYRVTILLLVLLVFTQLALFANKAGRVPPPAESVFATGERVTVLNGWSLDGQPTQRAIADGNGRWTAVIAYYSTCSYSEQAADQWRDWLRLDHPFRVVAITKDSVTHARAYRNRHEWRVEVIAVPDARLRSAEARLSTRTPWVYLFDSEGVLRYTANGKYLPGLDRVALDLGRSLSSSN